VAGASLSYSPEYEASRSNDEFMEKIAKESGGRLAGAGYDAFSRDLPKMARPKPVWEWLLLAGLLLVPVDVFVRRVYLDWAELFAATLKLFRRRKAAEERTEGMGSLLAAKGRATAEFREEQKAETQEARKEFRERLQQAETQTTEQKGSVFDKPAGAAPARHREKQTYAAGESKPTGGGSSLSDLKKAKERAKKKM